MSTATTIIEALGGWENISNLEACITRIRLDAAREDRIRHFTQRHDVRCEGCTDGECHRLASISSTRSSESGPMTT